LAAAWRSVRRCVRRRNGLLDRCGRKPEESRERLVEFQVKKIALATAKEPKASAPRLVGLRPETTPKPKSRSIAHDTTMMMSGQEIGLAS
jgi:hypothetical protein